METISNEICESILLYLNKLNKTSEVIPSDKTDDGIFFRIRINYKHLCRIRIIQNQVSICEFHEKTIDSENNKKIESMINEYFNMSPNQFEIALNQVIITYES